MIFKGLTLDKFQEDAVNKINEHDSVIVSAPTGSGKTLIADYIIQKELEGDKRVIYTAPIKALSNQKFKDFCEFFGKDKIGLITGDIVINPKAQVLIMTTEVYRNMAIINDPVLNSVSYCIMDEIHFISDAERGHIWEESIIFSGDDLRFLFLSATIPNAREFADWVSSIKSHNVEVIESDKRPVPLKVKFFDAELGITDLEKIEKKKELDDMPHYKGVFHKRPHYRRTRVPPPDYKELIADLGDQLPCIYFVFSRLKTQDYASKMKQDFLTQKEKEKVAIILSTEFRKMPEEVQQLSTTVKLRKCLLKGIGFHHAGLLPDLKHVVEMLFADGLLKVLFATETFAVGINMPAKTVCIDNLQKFTGQGFRYLTTKEFFQISGRAGRRGMDKEGLSVTVIHRPSADFNRIRAATTKDSDPIKSQFKLSYNTILNMIDNHTEDEIKRILMMNFFTFQKNKGRKDNRVLGSIKARFTKSLKFLIKNGYVENGTLSDLGKFASNIFSEEIIISQIFGFGTELDEYGILLVLAALIYEDRRLVKFYERFPQGLDHIRRIIQMPLVKGKWQKNLLNMTAIIKPCYDGMSFTDILANTNLLEGDIIRLLLQVLDRLEQIDRATQNESLKEKVVRCKQITRNCLEGIGVI